MDKNRPLSRTASYLLTSILLCVFIISAGVIASANLPEGAIIVDTFASAIGRDNLPEGWKQLLITPTKRQTRYSIEKEKCDGCLKAQADGAASALYKEMNIDLHSYPILSWRWRVGGTLKDGNAHFKSGDDYPARIYAAFEFEPEKATTFEKIRHKMLKSLYGIEPPGNTITYIWANKLPKGEMLANAFSDKVMMVAVESGDALAGDWVDEERNVYEDYKRLFKEEPPLLRGVIVMTDSDNTGASAVAWYDDIILKKVAFWK